MMEEEKQVLIVDHVDQVLGSTGKENAHKFGILHRAFSIFVYRWRENKLEFLLQRRAMHKYHSRGLWTNTCCSHAEDQIPLEISCQKRLQEEMGFTCPVRAVGSFYYYAPLDNNMIEHEIDHVFISEYDPISIQINPDEVMDYKWEEANLLITSLKNDPASYTAWLSKALDLALPEILKKENSKRKF